MGIGRIVIGSVALYTLAHSLALAQSPAARCEQLRTLSSAQATVTATQWFPGGRFVPPGQSAAGLPALFDRAMHALPPFCRVSAVLHPVKDSSISTEVWLPEHWNHRYLQGGNESFGGSIPYVELAAGVRLGFAVAVDDDGHEADDIDARWGLNAPDKVTDFGHRAVRETALNATRFVASYYSERPQRAYFSGCSDGGRDSLMAAQRDTDLFDGWLVGAPENDLTREQASELFLAQASARLSAAITPEQLRLLAQAAQSRCDNKDGVVDGLISDPLGCDFDPASLSCAAAAGKPCIPAAQLTAIEQIYNGWHDDKQRIDIPGLRYAMGTEDDPGQWTVWLSGLSPATPLGAHQAFAAQFFAFLVYADPTLNILTLDPGDAYKRAVQHVGAAVDANSTDLSRLRAAGKKIIQYHGWADVGVPAQFSLDYYHAVEQRMGGSVTD